MFIEVRVTIIHVLSQAVEPMVLTNIPEISILKAKGNLDLSMGKSTCL